MFHGVGQDVADFVIAVRSNSTDLSDRLLVFALNGHGLELGNDLLDSLVHAALHVDWVNPCDNSLEAFDVDRFGENCGGGGSVTGGIGSLAGDFTNHTGTHVFELVFEFDFTSNRYTVLGHGRRAKALLDDDVSSAGSERHSHGSGELLHTTTHCFLRFLIKGDNLGHSERLLVLKCQKHVSDYLMKL